MLAITRNLKQYVPSAVCLACDGCCRFKEEHSSWRPRVMPEEAAAGGKKDLAERIFGKEALDAGRQINTVSCHDGTHRCRFFSPKGNVCTIYALRPFECRLYPFVLMQVDDKIVLAVHLNCPYVAQNRNTPQFEKYVAYLKQFFQKESMRQLIKSNESLVDDYAGYEEELECLFPVPI